MTWFIIREIPEALPSQYPIRCGRGSIQVGSVCARWPLSDALNVWCVESGFTCPTSVLHSPTLWRRTQELQLSFFCRLRFAWHICRGPWRVPAMPSAASVPRLGNGGRSLPSVTAFNGLRAWLCASLPARRVPLTRQSNWNRRSQSHSLTRIPESSIFTSLTHTQLTNHICIITSPPPFQTAGFPKPINNKPCLSFHSDSTQRQHLQYLYPSQSCSLSAHYKAHCQNRRHRNRSWNSMGV